MVLNVEQEYERRRRLEDEYKARLERFRYGIVYAMEEPYSLL